MRKGASETWYIFPHACSAKGKRGDFSAIYIASSAVSNEYILGIFKVSLEGLPSSIERNAPVTPTFAWAPTTADKRLKMWFGPI